MDVFVHTALSGMGVEKVLNNVAKINITEKKAFFSFWKTHLKPKNKYRYMNRLHTVQTQTYSDRESVF